jgi:hypothetical protein
MIDWMNPSEDVVEAKRVGWHEGYDACNAEYTDEISAAAATVSRQQRIIEILQDVISDHLAYGCSDDEFRAAILKSLGVQNS